jgi:predicted Zn-dependent peptidase
MLFKGTESLRAVDVNEAFDRTGSQFNAFTTEESTVYYAAVLPEFLAQITDLWAQLLRPSLRDDDFDMEKNVILEEIAMYQDMPHFDVMDRCRGLHFQGHPCGNSVLGSVESVQALSSVQMRDYFGQRYAPDNMVVTWVGNVDWDAVCAVVESRCGQWPAQGAGRTLSHAPGSGTHERLTQSKLAREHICLMSEGISLQDPRRFAAMMLGSIIGDDVGSRYYWELVDPAVAEAAAMQFGGMDGTGIFYSYFRCSPDRVDQVLGVVNAIFAQLKSEGIQEEELTRARNKTLSALAIKNEVPMGRLVDLGLNWVYLKEYGSLAEDMAAIKAVTRDAVEALLQELEPGRFTRFSIGP